MTCPSCDAATSNPASGLVHATCDGCMARSLAKSQAWEEARTAKKMTPEYRSALQRVFEKEWREGHERVKHWDQILRSPKC